MAKDTKKKILDVATGTGDVAIEMTKRLNPTQIIGLDISKEMLEVGKKKIKKRNLSEIIEMEVGDSEKLRFEDNTFDAITVAFGVRNFENLEKGIAEMNRVLKKDGKLIVLEFSRPSVFPIKQAFNFYFKYILPGLGRFFSKDKSAYTYLPESVAEFPYGQRFLNVLDRCGYKNCRAINLSFGIASIYYCEK